MLCASSRMMRCQSILCGSDFSVRILVPRFQPLDSLVQLLWSVPYLPRADRFRQRRNFERDERSEEASDLRGEDDVVLGELGGLRVAAAGAMPDEDLEPLGVRLNLRLPLAQSDHGAVEHKGYMRHSQSWSSTKRGARSGAHARTRFGPDLVLLSESISEIV
jgi:hypothetical protein